VRFDRAVKIFPEFLARVHLAVSVVFRQLESRRCVEERVSQRKLFVDSQHFPENNDTGERERERNREKKKRHDNAQ